MKSNEVEAGCGEFVDRHDMTLVPVRDAGANPGTHALVIGISDYPFLDGPDQTAFGESLGLRNLSSAARSASEVALWLVNEYRNPTSPLASLRLLLSPAASEVVDPDVSALLGGPAPADRKSVVTDLKGFRDECLNHPENAAFVYIAGHGVQLTGRGAVVLLHDFGSPDYLNEFESAIDVAGCHDSMDAAAYAQHQMWFVDACRQVPDIARRFEHFAGPLTLSKAIGSVKSSPLFLASSTREQAFAEVGGTTLFSQALLWALRGGAAVGPDERCPEWHVGATQLIQTIPDRVTNAAAIQGEGQHVDVTGRVLNLVAQQFSEPPNAELLVTLRPEDLTPPPIAELLFAGRRPVPIDAGWPLRYTGPAGLYSLNIRPEPPYAPLEQILINLAPPSRTEAVEVHQ